MPAFAFTMIVCAYLVIFFAADALSSRSLKGGE